MLETELAASEARFSKVFDASPSLISITVLESSQLYAVNQAWLNVTGYSRDEVIGKTALELKLWADPNQRAHFIETFRKTKKMRNYELQMRSKAGEVRSYIASGEEIEYDGQPCLMLAFSDITERRQAEEVLRLSHDELERKVAERTQELQDAKAELEDSELRLMQVNRMLNSVLDNIPVRVFWKDLDLNIIGCNRPYAMDAGFQNPRQVVGKSDFDMVWHDQAEVNRATDRAVIKTNQPHHGYEESYINPDGRETWRRKSKSPLRDLDGHVVGVLGIYEDITQRRTAEKELERAKSEAERANQAKSQFLSSMSHELRTPLNAILGFAQLLEYDPRHPLLDAQKESVEHIKTGGDHLLNLINEVLELAKIEAGHVDLKIESVNPQDVFYETVPMAQSLAENRGLTFHVPVLTGCWPNIRVDALRLKQVLLNLLSNAVKYNVDGGEFTLDCKEVDGSLKIIVSDTGRGISPQGLEYLFQPFNRLGHENSNIEGTGIGLTITKQLVEHMGGQIGVESPPGKGTTFYVAFPLFGEPHASAPGASGAEPNRLESLSEISYIGSVLYVEDNKANALLMEEVFEQFPNLRLITANNAEYGLELAAAEQTDLIMLDIDLPGMSGLEMLKILRSWEGFTGSIIAVSAHAMPHHVKEGLAAGFDAYLTKPFDFARLTAELERVFGQLDP